MSDSEVSWDSSSSDEEYIVESRKDRTTSKAGTFGKNDNEISDAEDAEQQVVGIDDEETAMEIAALERSRLMAAESNKGAPQGKKKFLYLGNVMDALREEMELKDLPWIETCTITSSEPIIIEDANNDLDRELAFYNQALEAAKAGREGVLKANVPFTRPDDYFAEMLKSDEHMERVRRKLIEEQKSIKNAEEAKKQRMLKKYGKKIQQEKLKERQEKKKQTLEKIKSLKQKHGSVGSGDLLNNDFEDQFDVALADSDNENGGGKKRKGGDGKAHQPNPKRQAKNKRYGMGGKKRGLKQNTSNSVDDISGFSHKKMKANVFGGKKGGKGKRPGKAVRQKMRNKK